MKANKGKKAILIPRYKLVGTMETMDLNESVRKLAERGVQHLIIDLVHVQLMNGAGIGFLVHTLNKFNRIGGTVRLKNVSNRLRECLDIVNLSEIFPIEGMKKSKLPFKKTNASSLCMYSIHGQDYRPKAMPCR